MVEENKPSSPSPSLSPWWIICVSPLREKLLLWAGDGRFHLKTAPLSRSLLSLTLTHKNTLFLSKNRNQMFVLKFFPRCKWHVVCFDWSGMSLAPASQLWRRRRRTVFLLPISFPFLSFFFFQFSLFSLFLFPLCPHLHCWSHHNAIYMADFSQKCLGPVFFSSSHKCCSPSQWSGIKRWLRVHSL